MQFNKIFKFYLHIIENISITRNSRTFSKADLYILNNQSYITIQFQLQVQHAIPVNIQGVKMTNFWFGSFLLHYHTE